MLEAKVVLVQFFQLPDSFSRDPGGTYHPSIYPMNSSSELTAPPRRSQPLY